MNFHQVAARLKQLLIARRLTISTAESVTAGHIQSAIASVGGSSAYFIGGVTAYCLAQKVRLLGVDEHHAAAVNCVSERVAIEMASGTRRMFGTSIGVSSTGYAEPAPEIGVESAHAYFAINVEDHTITARVDCAGLARVDAQQRIAGEALAALVHELEAQRTD